MKHFRFAVRAALLLTACGDLTGPKISDLRGTWEYDAVGMRGTTSSGSTIICSMTDVIVQVSGATGTPHGGLITCSIGVFTSTDTADGIAPFTITLTGSAITFKVGGVTNVGTLSGKLATGTASTPTSLGTFTFLKR